MTLHNQQVYLDSDKSYSNRTETSSTLLHAMTRPNKQITAFGIKRLIISLLFGAFSYGALALQENCTKWFGRILGAIFFVMDNVPSGSGQRGLENIFLSLR